MRSLCANETTSVRPRFSYSVLARINNNNGLTSELTFERIRGLLRETFRPSDFEPAIALLSDATLNVANVCQSSIIIELQISRSSERRQSRATRLDPRCLRFSGSRRALIPVSLTRSNENREIRRHYPAIGTSPINIIQRARARANRSDLVIHAQ